MLACNSEIEVLKAKLRKENGSAIVVSRDVIPYERTAGYAESLGFTVRVFAPAIPERSDTIDLLGEFSKEGAASVLSTLELCSVLLGYTEGAEKEPRAEIRVENALLAAIVLFVLSAQTWPEGHRTLDCIVDLMAKDDESLDCLFGSLPAGNAAAKIWATYFSAEPAYRSRIKAGLSARFAFMHDSSIRTLVSSQGIDLARPSVSPCVYYFITGASNLQTVPLACSVLDLCLPKYFAAKDSKRASQELNVYVFDPPGNCLPVLTEKLRRMPAWMVSTRKRRLSTATRWTSI